MRWPCRGSKQKKKNALQQSPSPNPYHYSPPIPPFGPSSCGWRRESLLGRWAVAPARHQRSPWELGIPPPGNAPPAAWGWSVGARTRLSRSTHAAPPHRSARARPPELARAAPPGRSSYPPTPGRRDLAPARARPTRARPRRSAWPELEPARARFGTAGSRPA
jgi:hypothetical protein